MNARTPQEVVDARELVRHELAQAFVLRRDMASPDELRKFIAAADAVFEELAAASRLMFGTHPDFALAAKTTAEGYSTARMALVRRAMPDGKRVRR